MPGEDSNSPDYIHEALDRAHIASSHLQMALGEHVVINDNPDLQQAYDRAVSAVEELYQEIGRRLPDDA